MKLLGRPCNGSTCVKRMDVLASFHSGSFNNPSTWIDPEIFTASIFLRMESGLKKAASCENALDAISRNETIRSLLGIIIKVAYNCNGDNKHTYYLVIWGDDF